MINKNVEVLILILQSILMNLKKMELQDFKKKTNSVNSLEYNIKSIFKNQDLH
jgi:hypothetical protein